MKIQFILLFFIIITVKICSISTEDEEEGLAGTAPPEAEASTTGETTSAEESKEAETADEGPKARTVSKRDLGDIRKSFLSIAKKQGDRFDKLDVARVEKDDWTIERFQLTHETKEESLKALVTTMEWRKKYGVNKMDDKTFPEEITKMNVCDTYGQDKDGRPLIWLKVKNFRNPKQQALLEKYLVYKYEKLNEKTKQEGITMVVDSTDSQNVKIDYARFMVETLQNHYPHSIKQCIITATLPPMMRATAKSVESYVNKRMRSKVKLATKEELTNYIDKKFLPKDLGGSHEEGGAPKAGKGAKPSKG